MVAIVEDWVQGIRPGDGKTVFSGDGVIWVNFAIKMLLIPGEPVNLL